MNIYYESEILADLAGELPAILPYEGDFVSPETRSYMEKYIMRKADVPVEKIHRCCARIGKLIHTNKVYCLGDQVAATTKRIIETLCLSRCFEGF